MRKLNKKGAEMTIGTLVVIVLAILVLVVLALGFGAGWSSLWSKITGFFSPVNVDSVKQACVFACTSQAKYDYCNRIRKVTLQDKDKTEGTCAQLVNNPKTPGFENCPELEPCEEVQTDVLDDEATAKTECETEMSGKTTPEQATICASSKRIKTTTVGGEESFISKTCTQLGATGC